MFASANVRSVAAALALCAVLAGCGVSVRGDGRAAGTTPHGAAAGSATASPTASPTATATESLDAAGIDPCALLTADAQDDYGVTDHAPVDIGDIDGATCRFVVDDEVEFRATVTDGFTLDQLRVVSRQQGRQDTTIQVRGFDAVVSYSPDDPEYCIAAVGVSPTGMVAASYKDTTSTASDEVAMCGHARDLADASIDGLLAQQ